MHLVFEKNISLSLILLLLRQIITQDHHIINCYEIIFKKSSNTAHHELKQNLKKKTQCYCDFALKKPSQPSTSRQ